MTVTQIECKTEFSFFSFADENLFIVILSLVKIGIAQILNEEYISTVIKSLSGMITLKGGTRNFRIILDVSIPTKYFKKFILGESNSIHNRTDTIK
ncbi:hypothetical protein HZS_1286 [Henneguya salminicola]|nr:hypothetical protein HZS_1286 [Henneguya salminicola]